MTDGQNNDSQDRASIAALRGRNDIRNVSQLNNGGDVERQCVRQVMDNKISPSY